MLHSSPQESFGLRRQVVISPRIVTLDQADFNQREQGLVDVGRSLKEEDSFTDMKKGKRSKINGVPHLLLSRMMFTCLKHNDRSSVNG